MKNFQQDLKRGQAGELQFLSLFTKLEGTDGRKGDILAPNGKIELKTDFYPMAKTANFFIERYSSIEVGSPGGPFQALAAGCDWFVYYYTVDKMAFVFQTSDIVKQIELMESKLSPVNIRNRKWTTVGYKVPRNLLCNASIISSKGIEHDIHNLVDIWGFKR